jgi:hypothetical protein
MRRALAISAALLLAALAGRACAPAQDPLKADPSLGPTREVAGVGVGYAHRPTGALLAAANYQRAFADASVLESGELRRRVAAVATPAFAPRMLAANSPGAGRLARSPFGAALRQGVASVFFGVPVSHRLLSYSPQRAIVEVWGFTLLGNAASVEPAALFGLAHTELAWTGGDWKIASTRASFGPTPRLASPRRGGEGFGLVELNRRFEPYGLAP